MPNRRMPLIALLHTPLLPADHPGLKSKSILWWSMQSLLSTSNLVMCLTLGRSRGVHATV